MGYMNDSIGYRQELLCTRSIVKKNRYVLLEPDGLVKNTIPGFENCDITILGSPEMGAAFVDYMVTVKEAGKNVAGFAGGKLEVFLYVLEGSVTVWNDDEKVVLKDGGYFFSPAGKKIYFENNDNKNAKMYLYKRIYAPLEGMEAYTVTGNINDVPWVEYEGMKDVLVKDFLPSATDLAFDMNMHVLLFKMGTSHGYIETHVQEHGAYVYSGKGMYILDGDWIPVKKGDYMFMDSYCPQASYGVGRDEDFAYIYSKDCNRDIEL